MNINKPQYLIIKHNDINYIQINEVKNKKNNKIKYKKMNKQNNITDKIEEDVIIENYPYEFYEEEINIIKNDDKQTKLEYIIDDTEPQPESDQQIDINIQNKNINLNKNIDNNSENQNVIDFDDESIITMKDKSEKKDVNQNDNLENINDIKLTKFNQNSKDKINEQIILENKENVIIKDQENENNKIIKNKKNESSNKENILNYSLDHNEIIDILNLNKENKNIDKNNINNENIIDNDISKIFLNQKSTKKLLEDLYEKEMKFKSAYTAYYTKLTETMNNAYFKEMIENQNKDLVQDNNKISKDFLIHRQTNTINDINIFCLNNNNNNNNYLQFNTPKNESYDIGQNFSIKSIKSLKKSRSESYIFNINNQNININPAYEEYKNAKINKLETDSNNNIIKNNYTRHPTIILSIRKFLNEYKSSIQNRTLSDFSKNPLLNYELYIDILNDLNYLDQNKLPQIYFVNSTIYRKLWNFLINLKKDTQLLINEEYILESNILLIFLLILNGFFNNKKIIDELEIELGWLKFENYEILIMKYEYIEANYNELIDIRKRNILKKSNDSHNLLINNNKQNNYHSEINSKGPDDALSEYFNSFSNNLGPNNNSNSILNTNYNKKQKKINHFSAYNNDEKKNNKQKKINTNNINKQLYTFKPRNNSLKKDNLNKDIRNSKNSNKSMSSSKINKIMDINQNQKDNIIKIINNNELRKSKNLKKSKIKKKYLSNNEIKYNELYNISKIKEEKEGKEEIKENRINDFINSNNNLLNKSSSNKNFLCNSGNIPLKVKSGNYRNKVKQNRTDLKKLFKNNEYKDGTINEKLEKIRKQRNCNSKPKGVKQQINYEEYTNIDKSKDKNNFENQKHKYQFRKHTPQKKNIIIHTFKIEEKEYILEHNPEENIEIEIMQLIQKNNINGVSAKSILEKIKTQKNSSNEIK